MSGNVARSSSDRCCESNPITLTFDGTTSEGNPAIVGFITSFAAAKWTLQKVHLFYFKMMLIVEKFPLSAPLIHSEFEFFQG